MKRTVVKKKNSEKKRREESSANESSVKGRVELGKMYGTCRVLPVSRSRYMCRV